MPIFPQTNKIKYKHADYFYIYHWKTTSNESNAGHIHSFMRLPNVSSQLCTFFLWPTEKLPFGSLFKTIFPSPAFCQDDLRVAMLLAPGQNRAAPEPSTTCMFIWETAEETWRRSLALVVAVKRCGRL